MPDNNIIPITRGSGNQPPVPVPPQQPQKPPESRFPTEVINLPSKGWFYDSNNPLSSGTLELKQMTCREEDILTSPNLLQKNIVLDKLLESVIINKAINPDDLLICDSNAAFFALRRLAYGDSYDATMVCGRCGKENNVSIDLGKMDNRPFDFDKYPKGENLFTFILPTTKVTLTYKILSKKDEKIIEEELTGMATKVNKGIATTNKDIVHRMTTRLAHIITAVNGSNERGRVRKFVNEDLLSKDSLAFRKHIRETMPDVDSTFDFTCDFCGYGPRKEEMPMGMSFFWPSDGKV